MDLIQQENYNRVVNHLNICFSYKYTDCLCSDMEFYHRCFRFYWIRGIQYFWQRGCYINITKTI